MSGIGEQQAEITSRIAKLYSGDRIRTIQDLEMATYGGTSDSLRKDNPVVAGTSGARNILYGAQLWAQVVIAANTFGATSKNPGRNQDTEQFQQYPPRNPVLRRVQRSDNHNSDIQNT